MIGYIVKNTMSSIGSVKRGICEVENGYLKKLTESKVERKDGIIVAQPLSGKNPFTVSDDTTVSMNMLLFTPSIFSYIEKKLPKFLEENKDNAASAEFLIPDVLFEAIEDDVANVKVIGTTATWHGVTYKEDLNEVKDAINKLVENGEYNKTLWS